MFLLMILWCLLFCRMLEDNKKKLVSDIGSNIFIERRIEPGDVSFSCLFLGFIVVKFVWVVAFPVP